MEVLEVAMESHYAQMKNPLCYLFFLPLVKEIHVMCSREK